MRFQGTLPPMVEKHRTIIGGKIQRLRKVRNWSQADLGASIGRHQSRVAKWELGQGKPEPHDILRIADTFNVSLRFLCDDSEIEPRQEERVVDVADMSEDEKFLSMLVKEVGARELIDCWLGRKKTGEEEKDTSPPKLASVSKRPLRPVE